MNSLLQVLFSLNLRYYPEGVPSTPFSFYFQSARACVRYRNAESILHSSAMHLFTLKTILILNSSKENLNFLLTDSTYRFYQVPNLASTRRQNLGRTNLVLFLFFSVKWQAYIQPSDKWVFETAMHYTKMRLDTQF